MSNNHTILHFKNKQFEIDKIGSVLVLEYCIWALVYIIR